MAEINELTATAVAHKILLGEVTCEELVRACLERVKQREPVIRAWAYVDAEAAIRHARELDSAKPNGPLYGIPIGVKDVFDTSEMPTEYNSPIYRNWRPIRNADCVLRVEQAGGVILGKTTTSEFAYRYPAPTANPHNTAHTPGGSSSGSAAAVADFMVPLAIGTQTGASTIRPASFCGIFGFKPSYSRISFNGGKVLSNSFDTIGLFARSAEDLALFDSVLTATALPEISVTHERQLRIGQCESPYWSEAEESTRNALISTGSALRSAGVVIEEVRLPEKFKGLADANSLIVAVEATCSLAHEYANYQNKLSDELRDLIETGNRARLSDVQEARALIADCCTEIDRFFDQFDAILTPSAPGEAPAGLSSTGSPIFSRIWTALYLPCISLPVTRGLKGLPVGVQIVGRRHSDRHLLGIASRLSSFLLAQGLR